MLRSNPCPFALIVTECYIDTIQATYTLQVTDYSRYNMASFKEEHKKEMREKQFPKDLEQAFQMGVRLGGK